MATRNPALVSPRLRIGTRSSRFSFLNPFTVPHKSLNSCILEGQLMKQRNTGKGWTKFWVEIRNDAQVRCFGANIGIPTEVFDLHTLQMIGIIPRDEGEEDLIHFCISNQEKSWLFAAASNAEADYWIHGIKILLYDIKHEKRRKDTVIAEKIEEEEETEESEEEKEEETLIEYFHEGEYKVGYITEEMYDEVVQEFEIQKKRISDLKEEIYKLQKALQLSTGVIEDIAISEGTLRAEYERQEGLLETTNVRLHDALSELSKFKPNDSNMTRKPMIVQKSSSIDFQKLVEQRNMSFLCWLGIFPSDIPMAKKEIQKDECNARDEFDSFITESAVIQVRHLKKYLAELILASFYDNETPFPLSEAQKEESRRLESIFRYFARSKRKQIEMLTAIEDKRKKLIEKLYTEIQVVTQKLEEQKLEKEKALPLRSVPIVSSSLANQRENKNSHRAIQLTQKILSLQEKIKQKDLLLSRLKEICFEEQTQKRKQFLYIFFLLIVAVLALVQ